jgi:adenosylmethionine-8-amino-7-oxononanoate aminotransferase
LEIHYPGYDALLLTIEGLKPLHLFSIRGSFSPYLWRYMDNSLVERDKQVIWHPYTAQKYAPDPIAIVKGDGVYIFDTNGKSYIDAISSWWVNLHGHAHPYIAEKIYHQAKTLEQVIFAGFTHEPAVQLAEKILNILPGEFSKIFYSDNGSTAVEVAIKMAIQFWWNSGRGHASEAGMWELGAVRRELGGGSQTSELKTSNSRNKIVALKGAYHGDTFGAMSVSERGIFTLPFEDRLFEVIFVDPANVDDAIVDFSDSDTIEQIACFIYEPLLQAAGGMKMHDANSFGRLLKKFKQHGIICIADEVMTGFGRTGKIFASEYIEQKPDIICLSKGLTGGTMALGLTACSERIYQAFLTDDKLKTFFHGHSYTANPIACTAGLASLELLQAPTCIENINRISDQHQIFIDQLLKRNSTTGLSSIRTRNPRRLGTVVAFEIETSEKDGYLNNISRSFTTKGLSKGIFLRPLGNTVYIMPPYCITQSELELVYEAIIEILNEE